MELPDLGKHCSEATCKQLDFLPLKCDACGKIFCREHIAYKNHNCSSAYKKDVQVPVCPLCNSPIPVKRGEQPDIAVGTHIDNECQSDPAINKRKVFNNKCSVKGCKVKEIVPVICKECKLNFCLKHRLETDHKCEGQAGAVRRKAMDAALSRRNHQNDGPSRQPTQNGPPCRQPTQNCPQSRRKPATAKDIQGSMSEDEALAQALALSMQGTSHPNAVESPSNDQINSDFMLAQAIAASEQQSGPSGTTRSTQNKCAVS